MKGVYKLGSRVLDQGDGSVVKGSKGGRSMGKAVGGLMVGG